MSFLAWANCKQLISVALCTGLGPSNPIASKRFVTKRNASDFDNHDRSLRGCPIAACIGTSQEFDWLGCLHGRFAIAWVKGPWLGALGKRFSENAAQRSPLTRLCWPDAGSQPPEALWWLKRGVAQLGSAGALGALGRRFESCRPDHSHSKGSRGSGDPSFLGFFGRLSTK